MTDTTTPAELAVPTAARAEFAEHHRLPPPNSSAVDWDEVDRDLRAFSRPIVAAELRRLAGPPPLPGSHGLDDEGIAYGDGEESVRAALRARANELDPR